ncbi:MAG: DEAD/DEAH box helicase [Myxococcales bacterium]|nr:DEAD/DEAH box helicase [Myxococcales bacterium]
MMTFETLGAHPSLRAALDLRGYSQPTAVQAAVLDPSNNDRDLIVSAETGSGKTVAFGLSLAPTLLGDRDRFDPPAAPGAPLALVLAPTRELALQVQRELAWLYASAGLRALSCVGGMEMYRQLRGLAEGVHLVVGTPGRVCDHLARGTLTLANLKAIVLDEADEMLDMGFREELETVLEAAPKARRTLMFSATMPPPILSMAKSFLNDPVRVTATPVAQAHRDIAYRAHRIAYREREHAVVNVLRAHDDSGAAIVFAQTREGVGHLHASLTERGFQCVALSGELTQTERNRALGALRDGRARVLVATDVAARGIDLPDLTLVVHADLPMNSEVLLHRSGRTGRAGKKGIAVVLAPADRKRFADRLFFEAKLQVNWEPVPSAESIRARDTVKITEVLAVGAAETVDEDRALARDLLSRIEPEALVAQLVSQTRKLFPEPEDLPLTSQLREERRFNREGPPGRFDRDARFDKRRPGGGFDRPPSGGFDRPAPRRPLNDERQYNPAPPARPAYERPSFRPPAPLPGDEAPRRFEGGQGPMQRPPRDPDSEGTWFVLDVGRSGQADPRWIVPMLCRRGGVTRDDIGVIRVFDHETKVEIRNNVAPQFAAKVRRPDRADGNVTISPSSAPRKSFPRKTP